MILIIAYSCVLASIGYYLGYLDAKEKYKRSRDHRGRFASKP